ncbi:putative serine esterase-domain-containing protein [Trichophaea hybrida]|nr:putative serine esterase-domain-containing protein [Trichophaea hybrida]
MLLVHTAGSTKVGEVRRYTVTYTPRTTGYSHFRPPCTSASKIPPPSHSALHIFTDRTHSMSLCVDRSSSRGRRAPLDLNSARKSFAEKRVELPMAGQRKAESLRVYFTYLPCVLLGKANTDGQQLRPAPQGRRKFLHYTPGPPELLERDEAHERRGYEHGGKVSLDGTRTFTTGKGKSVTWIIEIISQVIFSENASVGYEILLGRDEKCLSFGYPFGSGNLPTERPGSAEGGVQSRAVTMLVQDERDLWNYPPFPTWEDMLTAEEKGKDPDYQDELRERRKRQKRKRKSKKVHLVILTHGVHGNMGADMLFLKEAIDEKERKATIVRREQRKKDLAEGKILEEQAEEDDDDDAEQVIVRGYHGNCCRTERGIKYLGKRVARYVLYLAHPNHNPMPTKSSNKLQKPRKPHHHPHLTPDAREPIPQNPQHDDDSDIPPYKISSISFLGHSLGGLVQTYAIAYIHAHSPTFFHDIKPVNFVAFATPFLGLSNENPIYVRFALDFGLVGKTGQDLGLTWRAPSAFSAFTGNGGGAKTKGAKDNSSKPLLRILPTGPAHEALKLFRNRTVYANVVNDGIVPLRTSCLLFLDWKGLGRVEKARRENGPVGGLVEWGWGQLVTNGPSVGVTSKPTSPISTTPAPTSPGFTLPSPFGTSFWGKSGGSDTSPSISAQQLEDQNTITEAPLTSEPTALEPPTPIKLSTPNPFSALITLLRPQAGSKPANKIYHRSQTHSPDLSSTSSTTTLSDPPPLQPPPRTTLLEAAGDVLNPPLPPPEFLISPLPVRALSSTTASTMQTTSPHPRPACQ